MIIPSKYFVKRLLCTLNRLRDFSYFAPSGFLLKPLHADVEIFKAFVLGSIATRQQCVAIQAALCYDFFMSFITKFIGKAVVNAGLLFLAKTYIHGFSLGGGQTTLLVSAFVLTLLYVFLRPLLRLITTPLRWITFGLFNVVISIAILWIADQVLAELAITPLSTLIWTSIAFGIINTIL